ncbi:COX15/CtaA family protein [Elstera litoralis]|uniref:COX15/CtaA family protein n=1 Tax=Elstera litoralis TaxID=552518 RepID=UPI000AA0050D|nr:COX15/CtaA family protein [Elstera litoralis]
MSVSTLTATARPALAPPARRAVALWLFFGAAMIFAMVVIGGVTRLTESGLSIVRWEPISGTLPPLSEADWQTQFTLYQQSPQYQQVNRGMSLAEFKTIFWWEFIHRLWGRLIGVVFAVPMLIFWLRGAFDGALKRRVLLLFALGGLQGAIGWWMVASGLRDVPAVSAYRLATHLGMALVIYALTLWTAFGLVQPRAATPNRAAEKRAATGFLALIAVTILAGAFVAGLDAGMIYNEFPFMGDGLVPPDYRNPALSVVQNIFENHAAVQFHHRVLAMAVAAGAWA